MPQPALSDVHVDAALTGMSVAFLQNATNFVANRVFPVVPVTKQSDRYFVFNREDFNRDEAKKRAPGTESSGSGYRLDNTPTFFCEVWGHHQDVSAQVMANADPAVDPERAAAEFVAHKLLIGQEVDWTNTFFTGGVWDNDVDGVASSPTAGQTIQWSDTTSGDPIGDIRAAKTAVMQETGFEPNTLTIGQPVFDALVDHPDIVDRVKYSGGVGNGNPAMVNEQTLAALFGLDRVLVAKAIKNSAAQGLTASHDFIAGKKALLTYSPPTPGLMIPSAGYNFRWRGYLGTENAMGFATGRIEMPWLKATRIEGETAFDHKIVSSALGYFWDTIVA